MQGWFGVDVGATGTRANLYAHPSATKSLCTGLEVETDPDYDQAMANVVRLLFNLGKANGVSLYRVGVAMAARLNGDCSTILSAGSLPTWKGRNFIETLYGQLPFGAIVTGHNDAAAQALAEARARIKRGPRFIGVPFIYIAPGTGIGTALVLWNGDEPVAYASEFQHARIVPQGGLANRAPCGCDNFDCAEALGSGRAAEEIFGKRASELPERYARALVMNQAQMVVGMLAGHPYITTVVVGGGLPKRTPKMVGWLQEYVAARAIAGMTAMVQPTLFRDGAGTLGALALLGGDA
jgi:predicted NBD/HSP70 family sugar kinase